MPPALIVSPSVIQRLTGSTSSNVNPNAAPCIARFSYRGSSPWWSRISALVASATCRVAPTWSKCAWVCTRAMARSPLFASLRTISGPWSPGSMTSAFPLAGSPRIVQLHCSGPTGKVSRTRSVLSMAHADNLMTLVNRALATFVLVLTAATAAAQSGGDSGSKVRVKRAVREADAIVLDLRIEPSWHIYAVNAEGTVGNATKINLDGGFQIAGQVVEPQPKHHK